MQFRGSLVPLDSIRGAKWFDRSVNNKLTKGWIIEVGGLRAGLLNFYQEEGEKTRIKGEKERRKEGRKN